MPLVAPNLLWPIPYPTQYDTGQPVQAGYDPVLAVTSAVLNSVPYVTDREIAAKLRSYPDLIEGADDIGSGTITQPDGYGAGGIVFQDILTNVTNEINGALSPCYPLPFVRTGTATLLQVSTVDANGAVTGLTIMEPGFYLGSPATGNSPSYPIIPKWIDPNHLVADDLPFPWSILLNLLIFQQNTGSGLSLTVTYASQQKDGLTGSTVTTLPTIVSGGTKYQVNDLQLLSGGTSFLPPWIRYAANVLVCDELYSRRLAPDEKSNPFAKKADKVRTKLAEIAAGMDGLDANFRRLFSPAASWTYAMRQDMNSL